MRSRQPRRDVPSRRRVTRHAHPEMGGLPPRSRLLRLRGVQPDGVVAAERPVGHEDGGFHQREAGVDGRGRAGLGLIASGEDVDDLGPPPAAGSRISGRVFDEEGRAVPNARVRLGVGGTAGRPGQLRHDGSIGGLHPPRAAARAGLYPDRRIPGRGRHDVGTGAGPRPRHRRPHRAGGPRPRARAEPRGAKILPARVRSSLFPENETDGFPAARPGRGSRDAEDPPDRDREPPAEEATSYAPRTKRASAAKLASAPSSATVRAGWTVRQQPSDATARRPRTDADTDDPRDGPPAPGERGAGGRRGREPAAAGARARGLRRVAVVRTHGLRLDRDDGRVSSNQRKARARRSGPSSDESLSSDDREPGSRRRRPGPSPRTPSPPRRRSRRRPMRGAGDGRRRGRRPDARKPANVRRSPRAATSTASRPRDAVRPSRPDAAETDESVRGRPASRPVESPAHLARAVDQPGRRAGRRGAAPQLGREEETDGRDP